MAARRSGAAAALLLSAVLLCCAPGAAARSDLARDNSRRRLSVAPPSPPLPPYPPHPPPLPGPPPILASTANDSLQPVVIAAFAVPSGVVFLIAVFLVWRYVQARLAERRAAANNFRRNMGHALGEWKGHTTEWDNAPQSAPHGYGPSSDPLETTKHHVPSFLGEPPTSPLAGGWKAHPELLNEPPRGVRIGSV